MDSSVTDTEKSNLNYQINIPVRVRVSPSNNKIPVVFIVSHERSGTHFLMNAISQSQNIYTNEFVNFDYIPLGSIINFYYDKSVAKFASYLYERQVVNLIKSHHHVEFFRSIINNPDNPDNPNNPNIKFIYIYRDPYETLRSYWYLIHQFNHFKEGRVTRTLSEFIFSEPMGQQLRYQHCQEKDMLDRWVSHVTGWLSVKSDNVLPVKYSDLVNNYEDTLVKISEFITPNNNWSIKQPDRNNYIQVSPDLYKMYPISETEEMEIRNKIEDRLRKRGLNI